ncbi:nucleotide exchange factor GrpE [Pseudoruegeria sp. SK021]|uniref:nucleotide exchange factor GrpE n=1 Tax=Pseudoruegeria sp. SK021 TaxID=1933035 RepID=UPI000A2257E7|nr:nucleotide exchange factor GrpE [Pseudoruegeria sp. SK021]OSP55331.1 nucleotide exchange factor GrpE [Pseudoruegeria sp. SK021]
MAEPKHKDVTSLDDIPSAAGNQEPMDLNSLAEETVDYASEDRLTAELEQALAERDEMRDRFMRALADAENARKRSDRDRREAEQFGGSKLSRDMLPVYDNLVRALDAAPESDENTKALLEGVRLTLRELLNIFTKHGITPIVPEIGDRFDPQLHQAMFEAPVPQTKAGDIIQVMTQGFLLHDRLLRPAQVGVSSTPAGS